MITLTRSSGLLPVCVCVSGLLPACLPPSLTMCGLPASFTVCISDGLPACLPPCFIATYQVGMLSPSALAPVWAQLVCLGGCGQHAGGPTHGLPQHRGKQVDVLRRLPCRLVCSCVVSVVAIHDAGFVYACVMWQP